MKIYNIYGTEIIKGDYELLEDCIIKNKANLSEADLFKTNITISQLYSTNCIDIRLDHLLLKIQGSRHLFCYYNNKIKIGCECHSIAEWLEHGSYTTQYSLEEREEYMGYIKIAAKLQEKEK